MQNYNAQTGEYEPALKGPNGESPSGFKSFKKQEEKDESFDTVNKKRMGKVKSEKQDFNKQEEIDYTDEEISEELADMEWTITGKETAGDYAKHIAEKMGISKDKVFAVMKKENPNITEDMKMSKIAGFDDDEDEDDEDEDSIWNAFESGKITEEERNKMLSERSGKIANESFDQINAKRMGKERAKPFKMPGTLRQRYNEYLKNGFSGKDIDKWNEEIEFIESKLPFKDEQEHQKWLDMASNWKGEPEWINMTNELIDRYNKSGEGGMDIEFRNFIKNPYDYEGTHSRDFVNKVLEHGRENYPNHPYFKKKPKLPF